MLLFYIHLHVASWFIALILFFTSWYLLSIDKQQPAKMAHSINRIIFLVIFYTGFVLIYRYTQAPVWENFGAEAVVKAIGGVYLVCLMEWLISRFQKKLPSRGLVIQFFLLLLIVIALGFGRLPWGFLP